MKGKRFLSAAAALLASVVLAVSSGAYITPVSSPSAELITDDGQWTLVFSPDINGATEKMSKIELYITLTGGTDKYLHEKAEGLYDGTEEKFREFDGFIGIGAEIDGSDNPNWYQFNYKSLDENPGSADTVAVKSLGSDRYLLTAVFSTVTVHAPERDVTINFKDWGNKSPNYSMTVNEMYVYGPDGSAAIHSDASGNLTFYGNSAASTTAAETKATATEATTTEETTTTTEETTAPAEETTEETSAETSEETTEADTTTTAEVTTTTAQETSADAAAAETAPADDGEEAAPATTRAAKKTSDDGFGSRDTTLMIVGIAAGGIIIAIIIVLVMMILKKKK